MGEHIDSCVCDNMKASLVIPAAFLDIFIVSCVQSFPDLSFGDVDGKVESDLTPGKLHLPKELRPMFTVENNGKKEVLMSNVRDTNSENNPYYPTNSDKTDRNAKLNIVSNRDTRDTDAKENTEGYLMILQPQQNDNGVKFEEEIESKLNLKKRSTNVDNLKLKTKQILANDQHYPTFDEITKINLIKRQARDTISKIKTHDVHLDSNMQLSVEYSHDAKSPRTNGRKYVFVYPHRIQSKPVYLKRENRKSPSKMSFHEELKKSSEIRFLLPYASFEMFLFKSRGHEKNIYCENYDDQGTNKCITPDGIEYTIKRKSLNTSVIKRQKREEQREIKFTEAQKKNSSKKQSTFYEEESEEKYKNLQEKSKISTDKGRGEDRYNYPDQNNGDVVRNKNIGRETNIQVGVDVNEREECSQRGCNCANRPNGNKPRPQATTRIVPTGVLKMFGIGLDGKLGIQFDSSRKG